MLVSIQMALNLEKLSQVATTRLIKGELGVVPIASMGEQD